jgi:hypothetical protein
MHCTLERLLFFLELQCQQGQNVDIIAGIWIQTPCIHISCGTPGLIARVPSFVFGHSMIVLVNGILQNICNDDSNVNSEVEDSRPPTPRATANTV